MEVEYTADTPIQLKESKVSFHKGDFRDFPSWSHSHFIQMPKNKN